MNRRTLPTCMAAGPKRSFSAYSRCGTPRRRNDGHRVNRIEKCGSADLRSRLAADRGRTLQHCVIRRPAGAMVPTKLHLIDFRHSSCAAAHCEFLQCYRSIATARSQNRPSCLGLPEGAQVPEHRRSCSEFSPSSAVDWRACGAADLLKRDDIVRALLMQLHLSPEQIGKLFLGSFRSWHDFWISHMPRDWSFVCQQLVAESTVR